MGQVIRLAAAGAKEILAAVDELRTRIECGEITALAVLAETLGAPRPRLVVSGRFARDPYRAMAALQRVNSKLIQRAELIDGDAADFDFFQ